MITLVGFSTGCTGCVVMKKRLQEANIEYRFLDANDPRDIPEVEVLDKQYSITGAPFLIFDDGETAVGTVPIDVIKHHIDLSSKPLAIA